MGISEFPGRFCSPSWQQGFLEREFQAAMQLAAGVSGMCGSAGVFGRDRRNADEDASRVEAERGGSGSGGVEHEPG